MLAAVYVRKLTIVHETEGDTTVRIPDMYDTGTRIPVFPYLEVPLRFQQQQQVA